MDAFALVTITILAIFLGFEVVSKVSSTLHTPLMSEANAIHGIILLGAIMVAGRPKTRSSLTLSIIAVLLATINVVGGFVVTDRMLLMFSAKPRRAEVAPEAASSRGRHRRVHRRGRAFILALKGLSNPRTARRGEPAGAAGRVIAVRRRTC